VSINILFTIILKIRFHIQFIFYNYITKFVKFLFVKKSSKKYILTKFNNKLGDFFPIGIWILNDNIDLNCIKKLGINLIVTSKDFELEIQKIIKYSFLYLKNVKFNDKIIDNPNIFGFYLYDEPELKNNNEKYSLKGVSRKQILKKIKLIRKFNKPTIMSISGLHTIFHFPFFLRNLIKYANLSDIYILNTYPILNFSRSLLNVYYGNLILNYINSSKIISTHIQVFKHAHSPKSIIPWVWVRYPTNEELRCMIYYSLTSGSKGLIFFAADYNNNPKDPVQGILYNKDLLIELRKIIRELKILIPFFIKCESVKLKTSIRPTYYHIISYQSPPDYLLIFIFNGIFLPKLKNNMSILESINLRIKIPKWFKNNPRIYNLNQKFENFNYFTYNKKKQILKLMINKKGNIQIFLIVFNKDKKLEI